MSLCVGKGFLTAHISTERLHAIRHNDRPPEMSTWEKIKEFFCSTHQKEAERCLRVLYHHQAFGLQPENIRETFARLRELASPGWKENFSIDSQGALDKYIIIAKEGEVLLSIELSLSITTTPPPGETHDEAILSAWVRDAQLDEREGRDIAAQRIRECLSNKVRELSLSRLNLSTLPACLPGHIKVLKVGHNRLTHLPVLPPRLNALLVDDNQLLELPSLPLGLLELSACNNQLTHLPVLPPRLGALLVDDNQLLELPSLPPTLTLTRACNNQLTGLPVSVLALRRPPCDFVTVENNPFSPATLQNMLETIGVPGYRGPRIYFSMSRAAALWETRPLHESVAAWLAPEQKGGIADTWRALAQEGGAAEFSDFLGYLGQTQDAIKHPAFKTAVAAWLTRLGEDSALRETTFAVAIDATASCEDRVTLAYNQMQLAALVHDVKNGAFDNALPELIAAGRVAFRHEHITQIAREKVKTLAFVDEIEVYLGFINQLRGPLKLTTATEEMRFFGVSGIAQDDLQAAEIRVKTAENGQFRAWVAQWEPWHRTLERIAPEAWAKAGDEKMRLYDTTYDKRVSTGLAARGLTGNADAERQIGVNIMDDINKTVFEAMTDSVLANNHLTSLLDERWKWGTKPEPSVETGSRIAAKPATGLTLLWPRGGLNNR